MAYKIKGIGSRCGVPLEDLITLYTVEALAFRTYAEAEALRDLAAVKFWFMKFEVVER